MNKVLSCSVLGVDGYIVEVQVDISNGMPIFNIVGLGDTSISESRERVKTAIKNSGYNLKPKRIIVNLSPADIKKQGTLFDLPIALGIMASYGFIDISSLEDYIILGELSLNGEVNRCNGVITAAITCKENDKKGVIIPYDNYNEAKLIDGIDIIPVKSIKSVINFLENGKYEKLPMEKGQYNSVEYHTEFKDIKGQLMAKRALEIAAAGGHNVLMVGSPGSGKSLLGKAMFSIMPKLKYEELIEVTKIYSISGLIDGFVEDNAPIRMPHHSSSDVSIIGGGAIMPKPGEISLAHKGILLLDEMPEFSRKTLESLRQPMEDGLVWVNRAKYRVKFPAEFILVGTANPCPCGYYGESLEKHECHCSRFQIDNYMKKISGPLYDRIDIHLNIKRLETEDIFRNETTISTVDIKDRVKKARIIQYKRNQGVLNGRLDNNMIKKTVVLNDDVKEIAKKAFDNLELSMRAFNKVLKLARTIADLDNEEYINKNHFLEALSYRKH